MPAAAAAGTITTLIQSWDCCHTEKTFHEIKFKFCNKKQNQETLKLKVSAADIRASQKRQNIKVLFLNQNKSNSKFQSA